VWGKNAEAVGWGSSIDAWVFFRWAPIASFRHVPNAPSELRLLSVEMSGAGGGGSRLLGAPREGANVASVLHTTHGRPAGSGTAVLRSVPS
jgi:hypothetical protein